MITNDKQKKITTDSASGATLTLINAHTQSRRHVFKISHENCEMTIDTEKSKINDENRVSHISYKILNINIFGYASEISYKYLIEKLLMGFKDYYGFNEKYLKNVLVDVSFSVESRKKLASWEGSL